VPDSSISQLLNWEVCFLCEKKTFKKDRKLKKIESTDHRNNLRESAVFKNDQRIIKRLDSKEFIDNAVYHSGCITGTNDSVIHVVCPGSTAVGSDIE
jgi:hypothetical protein